MKRRFVKGMAVTMAATMILGSTMTVFATEQQTTDTIPGTGEVEGIVDASVFDVVIPSVSEGTYDFRLDPQGLIEATGTASTVSGRESTHVTHERYENAEFAVDTTMYFANSITTDSPAITLYTGTSAAAEFVNQSTTKVDVTVTAEVKDAAGIAISEDKTFADDTTASMYLELNDTASASDAVDNTTKIATLTKTLDALADTNFEKTYDAATGEYSYELIDSPTIEAGSKFSYALSGAANPDGVWTEAQKDAAPAIEVTWRINIHREGTAPVFSTGDTLGTIEYTAGTEELAVKKILKVEMTNEGGTFDGYNANPEVQYDGAEDSGSVITLADNFLQYYALEEYTAKVTYENAAGDIMEATVVVKTTEAN